MRECHDLQDHDHGDADSDDDLHHHLLLLLLLHSVILSKLSPEQKIKVVQESSSSFASSVFCASDESLT